MAAKIWISGYIPRNVIHSLVGALYADGGYRAAAPFVESLFPEMAQLVDSAHRRIRVAADLDALREQLEIEGALRDNRRVSREQIAARHIETQAAKAAETSLRSTAPVETVSTKNYKAELALYVTMEGLGKLKFRTSYTDVDGARLATVTVAIGSKKYGMAQATTDELATQEAARIALESLNAS